MEEVKLLRPEEQYAEKIAEMREEYLRAGSSMDGCGGLSNLTGV